jgi:hypothetical protein
VRGKSVVLGGYQQDVMGLEKGKNEHEEEGSDHFFVFFFCLKKEGKI